MRELFDLVEDTKDRYDTYFEMSMVEIYNETIRDLLGDDYPNCPYGGLKLLENEKERVTIDKVTLKRPTSVEEVMSLVMLGNDRRSTSFTERNSVSSRSHLVLQINVGRNERGTDIDVANSIVRQCSTSATLSIIDLAGSEKASVNRGQRMKEGANINKSLLALSGCISALCQRPVRGVRVHVPYRDSKLTRLLKFSLGGNCRTVMINCISPSSKDIEETNNTLLWADKAKKVSTKVSRNTAGVELRTAQWLQKIVTLEETIKTLRSQLDNSHNAKSGLQQKRLEKARAESQEELGKVQTELDALLPIIVEGSEMEALWSASVLQVEALEARLQDITVEVKEGRTEEDAKKEKDHLRSLIVQQDDAFRFNHEIQAGIQNKSLKYITLTNLLKKAEERMFGEDIEEALYQHQLKVAEHKAHTARSVAAARERGLRDYISQQAEALAKAASAFSRFSNQLRSEISAVQFLQSGDDLASVKSRLLALGNQVDQSTAVLFGKNHPLPAAQSQHLLPVSLAAPSPRRVSIGRHAPSPMRHSQNASPKSVLRKNLFSGMSVPEKTTEVKPRQIRWPDETGEGKIDDRSIAPDCPVFSSLGSGDEESVLEEETGHVSMIPPSLRPASTPSCAGTSQAPSPSNASINEEIPAWKQMRIARGLASQIGGNVAGNLSCDSKSPTSGSSRVGSVSSSAKPNRPGPLSEMSIQTSASPNPPSSSTSSLLKPTASSAAKANGSSAFANIKIAMPASATAGAMLPPPVPLHRRDSMIGPDRHGRPKQRLSMIPSHAETLFPGVGKGLPSGGLSNLSGGARTISNDSKKRVSVQGKLNVRRSLMATDIFCLAGSVGNSYSPPVRAPSMSSRPSLSNLRGAASAGDTSVLASRGLSTRPSMSRLNAGDVSALGPLPRPSLSTRYSMNKLNSGVTTGDAGGKPAWR